MKNENNIYMQKQWNRKRNFCHWKLGIRQMIQFPMLNILLFPIIALTVIIWLKMDYAFAMFNVPEIILPIYTITIRALGILIPILLVWELIDMIGTLTARKDEAFLQMAFYERELVNGAPLLMSKAKDKKAGITVRKWYSPIPLKIWIERQDRIEHHMREHLKKEFEYDDANDSRIVMYSAKGTKHVEEENPVYDMNLENDMEKYVK